MKFLLDTNILIPAEPTSAEYAEERTPLVAKLLGLIAKNKSQTLIHPASIGEMQSDKNEKRRALRNSLLAKYVQLEAPPPVTQPISDLQSTRTQPGCNDEVDAALLAAVYGNAVDFLVTDDRGIHQKAMRLAIKERVLTPEDAIATIRAFIPVIPVPPPAVRPLLCHEIDIRDPIFGSLRSDYHGFDEWFANCQREHRRAFAIGLSTSIDGVAVVKAEQPGEYGIQGKTLKICTFKVSDSARGYRYGELLLKAIFDYAEKNSFDKSYVTFFPHQLELLMFFETFGFSKQCVKESGELVYLKRFDPSPSEQEQMSALDFHIQFGPRHINLDKASLYIVPIRPEFHRSLFPEIEHQPSLFEGLSAVGNTILKAYLCNSNIRHLEPGSVLLFYRSGGLGRINAIGVVDACKRLNNSEDVLRFVGQRTVYSICDINKICRREALAILFRQSNVVLDIESGELYSHNVLRGPPQQISVVKSEKGKEWICRQIKK